MLHGLNRSMIETLITSGYYSVKIHTRLCLLLRNSTDHNWGKSSTNVKHDNNDTPTQKKLIFIGKHNCLGMYPEVNLDTPFFRRLFSYKG